MKQRSSLGFTLMEILIVISILLIILFITLQNLSTQVKKANDARRKNDLAGIQKAFEEYYNDASCYPGLTVLDSCGGPALDPYVGKVPCDPAMKNPYFYVEGNCSGYRICAKLENLSDPDIARIECDPVKGCGYKYGYNYCIASGLTAAASRAQIENMEAIVRGNETPTQMPTPDTVPGVYACTKNSGRCNEYLDTSCTADGGCCAVTMDNPGCLDIHGNSVCATQSNWCTNY